MVKHTSFIGVPDDVQYQIQTPRWQLPRQRLLLQVVVRMSNCIIIRPKFHKTTIHRHPLLPSSITLPPPPRTHRLCKKKKNYARTRIMVRAPFPVRFRCAIIAPTTHTHTRTKTLTGVEFRGFIFPLATVTHRSATVPRCPVLSVHFRSTL